MEHMRTIESDLPAGITLPEYRRMIRPNRHSPIRRFISSRRLLHSHRAR